MCCSGSCICDVSFLVQMNFFFILPTHYWDFIFSLLDFSLFSVIRVFLGLLLLMFYFACQNVFIGME